MSQCEWISFSELRKRLSGLPPDTVQEADHVAALLATYWQGFWVPAPGGACEQAPAYGGSAPGSTAAKLKSMHFLRPGRF